jgi:hypothetical protein
MINVQHQYLLGRTAKRRKKGMRENFQHFWNRSMYEAFSSRDLPQ